MDTALRLRLEFEQGKTPGNNTVDELLSESPLVKKLTSDFVEHPLFAVFRIMGLCEIPGSNRLPYTKKLLSYISSSIATEQGFAPLGGIKEIVPCYNAMLLEAYYRLGLAQSDEAQAALRWIKLYQLFERGQTTAWPHKGICKHGGCLLSTPCYIGIGKTVRALITYAAYTDDADKDVRALIATGTEYMLRHNMFRRLSNQKPISPHITDIMMPQSYALSLTDLVYIVGKANLTKDPRCGNLLDMVSAKQVAEKQWKIDYIYSYKGYVGFDSRRKPSAWISTLFPLWLT